MLARRYQLTVSPRTGGVDIEIRPTEPFDKTGAYGWGLVICAGIGNELGQNTRVELADEGVAIITYNGRDGKRVQEIAREMLRFA